jgi:hypothetical protein
MKKWEIVKGMSEGLFTEGDKFKDIETGAEIVIYTGILGFFGVSKFETCYIVLGDNMKYEKVN